MPIVPRADAHARKPRRAIGQYVLTLLLVGFLLFIAPAHAQSCWTTTSATLDFGTISATANTDAQTSIPLTCQAATGPLDVLALHVTFCVYVGEGNPTGIDPRRMSNNNGAFMAYNLYSDPARTQLIGPGGGNYPVYALSFDVPARQTTQVSVPFYGRVPAGQALPASFPFQGLPAASVIRYSYSTLLTPSVADCNAGNGGLLGGAGQTTFGWTGVYARAPNACVISTATDLDFGIASTLSTARSQTSTIQLQCPIGAAWLVTLNDGSNANGTTRRMASGGDRINYELYRDSLRQSRWGNTQATGMSGTGTNATQSLTVYGQVPIQAGFAPGTYSDTITVTLTY